MANRNHFLDQLDAALASDAERLAVLYLDLDGFKAVNDNHGHRCGDQVLRVVAERLASTSRPGDVCGRLGGDEFVAFFRDVDGRGRRRRRASGPRRHHGPGGAERQDRRDPDVGRRGGAGARRGRRPRHVAPTPRCTRPSAGGGVELA
ncbi:MAG: GGDEF domain-containing protein [Acidimicrobiales bacterium]